MHNMKQAVAFGFTTDMKTITLKHRHCDICLNIKLSFFISFPIQYGIVLDAGSSHTQMFIYKWKVCDVIKRTALVNQIGECTVTDEGMILNMIDTLVLLKICWDSMYLTKFK